MGKIKSKNCTIEEQYKPKPCVKADYRTTECRKCLHKMHL